MFIVTVAVCLAATVVAVVVVFVDASRPATEIHTHKHLLYAYCGSCCGCCGHRNGLTSHTHTHASVWSFWGYTTFFNPVLISITRAHYFMQINVFTFRFLRRTQTHAHTDAKISPSAVRVSVSFGALSRLKSKSNSCPALGGWGVSMAMPEFLLFCINQKSTKK